jgi:SAM-dependent methyltransferase
MNCQFCNNTLTQILDLGYQPPSNSFLTNLDEPEVTYPLRLYVCEQCWLVQVPEFKSAREIFSSDYVYYSSESPANVQHAKEFAETMCERFKPERVLEIGSNDGYMLQFFQRKGCGVIGVDPAEGPARSAHKRGIPTIPGFFRKGWAGEFNPKADLICGINVLAHQPDINDFVQGLKIALKPDGVITMEFPHLMNLIDKVQFDTIYHEHYSYFSFATVCEIFHQHGLAIFDVDEIPEHGGSLRIYAKHEPAEWFDPKTTELILREQNCGMFTISHYENFQSQIEDIRRDINEFLYDKKYLCDTVIGYGAPAKASTFLNYCGIRSDILPYIIDRSPHKIGEFMPGSHIPIVSEDILREVQPKYVLILAWNLKDEVMNQLSYIEEWGGQFVVAMPELEVI